MLVTDKLRREFHERQMRNLHPLVPGADPDPPVILCEKTAAYDDWIQSELKQRGWSQSARARSKIAPPAKVKGIVLARKLAKNSLLNEAEIRRLGERIQWMQRNDFRWEARDGYDALAPVKTGSSALEETLQTPSNAVLHPASTATGTAPSAVQIGQENKRVSGPDRGPRNAETDGLQGQCDAELRVADCDGEGAKLNGGRDVPGEGNGGGSRDDRSVLDTRGGENNRGDSGRSMSTNEVKSPPQAPSDPSNKAASCEPRYPPKPKCFAKGVSHPKAKALLLAICFEEPLNKVISLAATLQADKVQLTEALSASSTCREDLRNTFDSLGFNLDD